MSNRPAPTDGSTTPTRARGAKPAQRAKHDAPEFATTPRRGSQQSDSSEAPGGAEHRGAPRSSRAHRGAARGTTKSDLTHDFENLMSDLGWHIERGALNAGEYFVDGWSSALDDAAHTSVPELRRTWDSLCAKVGSQFESLGWGDDDGRQHHHDAGHGHAVNAVRQQGGVHAPVAGGHAARQHHATDPDHVAATQRLPAENTRRLV